MQERGVSRVGIETASPRAIPAPGGNSADAVKTSRQPTGAQNTLFLRRAFEVFCFLEPF